MISPTKLQKDVFDFIKDYFSTYGRSPSFDDIANRFKTSRGNVHRVITCLEERGLIRRLPRRARSLEIIDDAGDIKSVVIRHLQQLEQSCPSFVDDVRKFL